MSEHLRTYRGTTPTKKRLSDDGPTPQSSEINNGYHQGLGSKARPRSTSAGLQGRLKYHFRSMTGRRKALAVLAIFIALILLTTGHISVPGTSSFSSTSLYSRPPHVPRGVHPIKYLMDDAEKRFDQMVARQSQTLEQCVREYKARYGRKPPKGFEVWWKFAKDRGLVLVDEFDTIHRDLEPFWGLSAAQIEERRKEMFKMANSDHLISIQIKDGVISDEDGPASSKIWPQNKEYYKLFQPFNDRIPDMNILINVNDQPLGFVSWEEKQRLIDAGRRGVYAPDDEQIPPDPAAVAKTGGFAFEDLRAACPPDSAARTYTQDFLGNDIYPLEATSELSFRFPQSQGGFIHNMTRAYDACHNTALRDQHGNFLKPELSAKCVRNKLYPIFTWSKYPASSDITIPTNFRFQWTKPDTANWEDMYDKVMWRGTLTGMFADTQAVMKSQRHRLMGMIQDRWGRWPVLTQDPSTKDLSVSSVRTGDAADRWTEIGITHRSWWRKTQMERVVDAVITPSERIDNKERAKYKMLLDVDGWGWSARYRELLRTTSATLKATVFHEAYSDWLIPWYHYIPLNYDYSDMFSILLYFFGLEESKQPAHDEELKAIADRSREWAETQLGWEQQKVYIFRLCLEWARLCSDNRSEMDYEG